MTEQDIQNLILIRITSLPKSFFWRANTGAAMQGNRFTRFGLPGQADILGLVNGIFIAIEVKTKTGRQSAAQKQWEENFKRAGGIYIIARSVDDVENAFLAHRNKIYGSI